MAVVKVRFFYRKLPIFNCPDHGPYNMSINLPPFFLFSECDYCIPTIICLMIFGCLLNGSCLGAVLLRQTGKKCKCSNPFQRLFGAVIEYIITLTPGECLPQ